MPQLSYAYSVNAGSFFINKRFYLCRRDASLLAVVAAQYHLIEFDPSEKRYDILNVYIYDYYDETLKLHDLAVLKVELHLLPIVSL